MKKKHTFLFFFQRFFSWCGGGRRMVHLPPWYRRGTKTPPPDSIQDRIEGGGGKEDKRERYSKIACLICLNWNCFFLFSGDVNRMGQGGIVLLCRHSHFVYAPSWLPDVKDLLTCMEWPFWIRGSWSTCNGAKSFLARSGTLSYNLLCQIVIRPHFYSQMCGQYRIVRCLFIVKTYKPYS